jgi:hypothetical protein
MGDEIKVGNRVSSKATTTTITISPPRRYHYSVKCRYCEILLVEREPFIGHMIHSHELELEKLELTWKSPEVRHDRLVIFKQTNVPAGKPDLNNNDHNNASLYAAENPARPQAAQFRA